MKITQEQLIIELSKRCNNYSEIVEILSEKLVEITNKRPELFGEVYDTFREIEPKLKDISTSIQLTEE